MPGARETPQAPRRRGLSRRAVAGGAAASAVAALLGGCGDGAQPGAPMSPSPPDRRDGPAGPDSPGTAPSTRGPDADARSGRLTYRPAPGPDAPRRTGLFEVTGTSGSRPAVVLVPEVDPGPLRLVVLMHGAGGRPQRTVELLRPYAAEHRLVLLAPGSRAATWDVITGGFGPDVANIDALLRATADLCPLAGHTVAGFSDGASYALTLGIGNGDVFDSVVAFSPGFAAPEVEHGRPRFFLSHGTRDAVLPIDRCSRRIVPALERQGYDVTYEEFLGGHEVPVPVRRQALAWLGGA